MPSPESFSEIVNPRNVIIVTCISAKEKDNAMTLTWHAPLSFDPPLYGILVKPGRYSYELIKETHVFCVNFIGRDLEGFMRYAGSISGKDVDKFEEMEDVELEWCDNIHCRRLKECLGYLECEVVDEVEVGDHVLFVGAVKAMGSLVPNERRLIRITSDRFDAFAKR
jgi:flavin reductase (DIM6/NTAB) family NADH-FMN oxidoreductase RutF